jgi:thymidine phosphorylase
MSALVMGAGRREYTDKIKPEVGLLVRKKIGDYVRKGDELVLLHAPDEVHWQQAQEMILQAYDLCKTRKPAPPLFYETF